MGEESRAVPSPLQLERMRQLATTATVEVDATISNICRAASIPRLRYHFQTHGRQFGASTPEEYEQEMVVHLARGGQRVFTYLRDRPGRREIMWELVDPVDGTTVQYNESRRSIWSFYRPSNPAARARGMRLIWVEIVRQQSHWQPDWNWQWSSPRRQR